LSNLTWNCTMAPVATSDGLPLRLQVNPTTDIPYTIFA
jgi:hypothetical protein